MAAPKRPHLAESTPTTPPETDGFSRRVKLQLIEGTAFFILAVGAVRLAFGAWNVGLPVYVLGAYVLLQPTQVIRLIGRLVPALAGDGDRPPRE